MPRVHPIVAVGSGKGRVGKTPGAANLARALRRRGKGVGVLDGHICGPYLPVILGIEAGKRRIEITDEKVVLPLEVHGVHVVSFGFFLGAPSPVLTDRDGPVAQAFDEVARPVCRALQTGAGQGPEEAAPRFLPMAESAGKGRA